MTNWSVHGKRITLFKFDIYLLMMTEFFFLLLYWDSRDMREWEKLAHPKCYRYVFWDTLMPIRNTGHYAESIGLLYYRKKPRLQVLLPDLGCSKTLDIMPKSVRLLYLKKSWCRCCCLTWAAPKTMLWYLSTCQTASTTLGQSSWFFKLENPRISECSSFYFCFKNTRALFSRMGTNFRILILGRYCTEIVL
jgi:hypothetical protein